MLENIDGKDLLSETGSWVGDSPIHNLMAHRGKMTKNAEFNANYRCGEDTGAGEVVVVGYLIAGGLTALDRINKRDAKEWGFLACYGYCGALSGHRLQSQFQSPTQHCAHNIFPTKSPVLPMSVAIRTDHGRKDGHAIVEIFQC
ncbi:hypothetical protein DMENIID0001_134580 [Sergentomyia squamirostris]